MKCKSFNQLNFNQSMKKLVLKNAAFQKGDLLSRNELKAVVGGYGPGQYGQEPTCDLGLCYADWQCPDSCHTCSSQFSGSSNEKYCVYLG